MDDSQDKVRRNLVVVAAAIILIQYLQIQIEPKATLGIFTVSKVPQLQFWLLALVVLLYSFQRYWFDGDTRLQRNDAWKEFYELRGARIRAKLTKEVLRYVGGGPKPESFSDLSELLNEFQSQNYPSGTFDSIIVIVSKNTERWMLNGWVRVEINRTREGRLVSSLHMDLNKANENSSYKLAFSAVLAVSVFPVLRTGLVSKTAVDFLVPLYLTVGALGVCVFRLSMAVLSV